MDRKTLHAIKCQPLSTVVTEAFICPACAIVDRDSNRYTVGYPCPRCSEPSKAGHAYFPLAAATIVDLTQQLFHSQPAFPNHPTCNPQIGIIIYFTTFSDLLLEHLLRVLMTAKQVASKEQDSILKTNLSRRGRIQKVFASHAGMSFAEAVREAASARGVDYNNTVKFCREVSIRRNNLVHEGVTWRVPGHWRERCIEELPSVADLFLALHNSLVWPVYRSTGDRFRWPS